MKYVTSIPCVDSFTDIVLPTCQVGYGTAGKLRNGRSGTRCQTSSSIDVIANMHHRHIYIGLASCPETSLSVTPYRQHQQNRSHEVRHFHKCGIFTDACTGCIRSELWHHDTPNTPRACFSHHRSE